MNIIDFKNVSVSYDYRFIVLKNINLTIKEGEHWLILGANGSGKTTLLKLMSNDLYPNTNCAFKKEIFGQEKWNISELKNYLGLVTNDLQNEFIYNARNSTAYDIIISSFYSSLGKMQHHIYTKEQIQKTNDILKELNLIELKNKKSYEMSTGELRKCLIARALIHKPKALLLDEPSSGLDIKAQHQFVLLLKQLSKKLSIIIITHHLEEIFEEITNVALIHNNEIYKQGKKDLLMTSSNISKVFDLELNIKKVNHRYFIENIIKENKY